MEYKGRETIGRFIATLYRMATVYLGKELPALKIGAGQYIILAELFDEEGQSQDELTRRVYVNKANTARALNRLEEVGYVQRIPDESDQRIKTFFLAARSTGNRRRILADNHAVEPNFDPRLITEKTGAADKGP